jgi:thiamine kinase-like enzyme
MIEQRFHDEVTFQQYANQLNDRIDFVSPKVYSWGKICRYKYPGKTGWFSCMYIIMEYIPHLTVKDSHFSKETMKEMYAKVHEVNYALTQELLCHNDLNRGNIMFEPESSKVVLIDYGETRIGPTTPLFSNESSFTNPH